MPKGLVNESSLNSIGEAINVLNGSEGTYLPSEMGEAIIDAIPTETVSGNPIHITDAANLPAESVVTTLEPVQEGSGDPSPENVRPITGHTGVEIKKCGKNLIGEMEQGGFTYNGLNVSVTNRIRTVGYIKVVSGMFYTINAKVEQKTFACSCSFYTTNDFITPRTDYTQWTNAPLTVQIPNGVNYIRVTFRATDDATVTVSDFSEIQLELGSSATNYEPYQANTFPVTFPALGKNLFDKDNTESGYLGSDGSVVLSNSFDHEYIPIEEGQTYTVSGINYNGGPYSWWYDKSMIPISSFTRHNNGTFTAPINAKYMGINAIVMSNTRHDIDTIQVEEGSTATTFEPYTNTAYGCEVDWTNGVLRVARVSVNLSEIGWIKHATLAGHFYTDTISDFYIDETIGTLSYADYICSIYQKTKSTTLSSEQISLYYNRYISANRCFICDLTQADATTAEFKSYLASHNAQLVYKLATPIEIQLTSEVITLLKGENNVWTDSGTSEIEYKVDLQSYIQKLINEASAQASTLSVSPLSLGKSAVASTDRTAADEIEEVDEPVLYDEVKASEDEPIEETEEELDK